MNEEPRCLSATTIVGNRVVNPAGQALGHVRDLMIDLETGQVIYAVLVTENMDGKLLAIPWTMFRHDTEQKRFVVGASRDLLEQAPGIDDDNWPQEPTGPEWVARIYEHYGQELHW